MHSSTMMDMLIKSVSAAEYDNNGSLPPHTPKYILLASSAAAALDAAGHQLEHVVKWRTPTAQASCRRGACAKRKMNDVHVIARNISKTLMRPGHARALTPRMIIFGIIVFGQVPSHATRIETCFHDVTLRRALVTCRDFER